jgi:histidine triad (HIT) family protein
MNNQGNCIFCKIVEHTEEASIVFEDSKIVVFMNIRPINPGEMLIIPKKHIDHFCDIPDEIVCHIMIHAQRLSRIIMEKLKPQRVGLVVHGFGVAHAHLIIVPQHGVNDITSCKFAYIEDGKIKFSINKIASPIRKELDELAKLLR